MSAAIVSCYHFIAITLIIVLRLASNTKESSSCKAARMAHGMLHGKQHYAVRSLRLSCTGNHCGGSLQLPCCSDCC
jgi:hypothetical protein